MLAPNFRVGPSHEIVLLLLQNCDFATIVYCNVNICYV